MKMILLTKDDQDNIVGTIFNSMKAAEKVREVVEDNGYDTFGIIRVISRVDVLLGEGVK